MTDVIILHRIPGARPGAILPLDERLERHVRAGNARVLPKADNGPARVEAAAPQVLSGASTGHASDADYALQDSVELADLHGDHDEDTED